MTDHEGHFRINWVAENTGIPEATLRAWERRYQVPKPARTPSGYRLYSQDDVAQAKRMRELCDAGISPSDAAREILQTSQGKEPLQLPKRWDEPADATQGVPGALPTRAGSITTRASGAGPSPDAHGQAPTLEGTSETRFMEVVTADHLNTAGVLSLSRAVAMMERAATITATRSLRSAAAVVSCGGIDLVVPVAAGQLLEVASRIVSVRDGSIAIDVEMHIETLTSGKREHVTRSTFMLIALGQPEP